MIQGTYTAQPDGTLTFSATCMICLHPVELAGLDPAAVAAYQAGAMVQAAFPRLSPGEREVLISGSHSRCFEDLFADDNDDEVPPKGTENVRL